MKTRGDVTAWCANTYDGLGSTTDLTNGSGIVTGTYSYDAFGAVRTQTGGGSNVWQFSGEQRDADSALYFLRARYYDPGTGRFVGKDPLNVGNRYSYVGNNPLNFVDPTGLIGWDDIGVPDITPDFVDDAFEILVGISDCAPHCILNEGVGLLPAFEIFGVSGQLWATCALYPVKCAAVAAISWYAQREFWRLFPEGSNEGTFGNEKEGDAFQHCFWSGLITIAFGSDFAKDFTTRYEERPGNELPEKLYDLHNNHRGREFAQNHRLDPLAVSELRDFCR